MLTRLKITNFLLIKELELDFATGLTVVTGETGSGKSIIIDALMYLFGAKTTPDIIRTNQKQVVFEAEFSLTNQALIAWLHEDGLTNTDDAYSILCRRVVDNTNKSKIYINGFVVTKAQAAQIGEYLLDIHTQFSSITLLKPEMQRNLLDEYAGLSQDVSNLGAQYKEMRELEQQLVRVRASQQGQERNLLFLRESIAEIGALDLKEGEWEELQLSHKQLANATFILQELDCIMQGLTGGEESVVHLMAAINAKLTKLVDLSPQVANLCNICEAIVAELHETNHEIVSIVNNMDQDSEELIRVEHRIEHIFTLSRKYRVNPDELQDLLIRYQEELNGLENSIDIAQLEQKLRDKKAEYLVKATKISQKRQQTAITISKEVTKLLQQLAIHGEFKVAITNTPEYMSYGIDNIEYKVCFNPGMSLQSLAKAASGGELSRTALALYLLLSSHNPPEVIIFDEIDVGIGGKVAAIVGDMLARLGSTKQVICITHQPQTASFGAHHLVVSKNNALGDSAITETSVVQVVGDNRVAEIARMLGGINITQTTIEHAREMLDTQR
jgi:DNA repair protein RecN (Recombination protein N)